MGDNDRMEPEVINVRDVIPRECRHPEPNDRIQFFLCWICGKYYDLKDGKYEPRVRAVK